jgi:predicted enzyme related to lactoylglutathione lyase
MFKGLRTALYAAPDLARAKDWYARVLGRAPYFDEPFYVGFNVGGFELGLVPDAPVAAAPGGTVACWGVADVPATYARLLELGAQAHDAPTEVGGGIVVATVVDPFGNLLGLIFNPHFNPAAVE